MMFKNRKHPALLKRVLVVCGERAFSGVLYDVRSEYIVLRDAQLIERGTEPARADGEVVLHRDKIDYIQAAGG